MAITSAASLFLALNNNANAAGITRIQSATGFNSGGNSLSLTLGSAPTNGNTLILVIGTRGDTLTNSNAINVSQTGVTWQKAVSGFGLNYSTAEIWYASNVSNASTAITITLGSGASRGSAVVAEYSGVAKVSALDKTAVSNGNSSTPSTGTTAVTSSANQLWIGAMDHWTSGRSDTFSAPQNGFTIVDQAVSSGGGSSNWENSALFEKVASSTGAAGTSATYSSSGYWGGAVATFNAEPALGVNGYRVFSNQNSTDVGSPMAAQNAGASLASSGQAFRIRLLIGVTMANLGQSGQSLKLQYRSMGSVCDATGSWADISPSTPIAYNDNALPSDGAVATANSNDPVISGATIKNQTYEELNDFTNSQAALNVGEYGMWDFSLKDNGAPADTAYCIRVANSSGSALANDTTYPVITTKGPEAIVKQDQFNGIRSILTVGASTNDGISTPLYFDQYMRSSSSSDVLIPRVEIKDTSSSFSNVATHSGDPVAYDPDPPKDTRHSCSAYDSANQQMITWGGWAGDGTKGNINDTWAITLKEGQRSQWKKLETTGTRPQATRAHVCIYDSLNKRLIVFGGWNGSTYLTTPWALTLPTDGSTPTWSQLATSGTAPNNGSVLMGMALYDPTPSRMIFYGGFTGSTNITPNVYQLTLPSSGTPTWSNIGLTTGASASGAGRDSSTLVYDQQRDRAILFAGVSGTGTNLNEVWSLNLAAGSESWTQITPTGTAPSGRQAHFAAWQPDYNPNGDDRMIAFAGKNASYQSDVWELRFPSSGSTPAWINATPGGGTSSMRPSSRAEGGTPGVYDPLNKRALFPYGYDGTEQAYNNEAVAFDLTDTDGTLSFYNLNDVRGLRPHDGAVMVYDPNNQEMIMHGGAGGVNGTTSYSWHLGTTWKMKMGAAPAWVDANSDLSPIKREFGNSVYDTINDRVVYCLGLHNANTFPNDCWQTQNPAEGKAKWTPLVTSGTPPPGRMTATTIYDSANNRMVIFGGKNSTALNDIHFLTFTSGGGATWSTPSANGTPPSIRWGAHAVYDPTGQRMVVFGGTDFTDGTHYNDTWELALPASGNPTWRQMSPVGTAPMMRRGGNVVYDPDRGDGVSRMVLFGGFGNDPGGGGGPIQPGGTPTHYNDTWELTVAPSGDGTWTKLNPGGTAPSARRSAAAEYDPVNDRMIVYGGRDATTFDNDTFSLSLGASPIWTDLSPRYYIPGTVKVTGLTNNTSYHWQGWYTGSVSGTSLKYSYGGNNESAADFTVGTTGANSPPIAPSSLTQNKVDLGNSSLSVGGWTNDTRVRIWASLSDPDGSDTLQLCVEVQPIGTAFTGTDTVCSSGIPYTGTPVSASAVITGLAEGQYHWQARVKDASGTYSNWVSYGGNSELSRDYGVDLTAPTGTVYDGGALGVDASMNSGSLTSLTGNWTIDNTISGLSGYEYSIGTTPGATDTLGWTTFSGSRVTANSLSLTTSQIYHFNIRATDNAGNVSILSSNGQIVAPTLTFSTSSNAVNFDSVNAANNYTTSQTITLTTATNAQNGYKVYGKATDFLTSQSLQIIGMFNGGTYAAPAAWGTSTGFGYHSSDTSVGGINRFNSATCPGGGVAPCFAPYATTGLGDVIADNSDIAPGGPAINDTVTITNKVSIDAATQKAGKYQTTVLYSAYATY